MQKNPYNFFIKNGYCIVNLFNSDDIKKLLNELALKINKDLVENECLFSMNNLKNFHLKNLSKKSIENIFESSKRYIKLNGLFAKKLNNKVLNDFLNKHWSHSNKKIVWVGSPKKGEIKFDKAGYRVFVPSKNSDGKIKKSAGLPHIDAYSKKENNFITLWIPLVGFTEKFTMMISPKSHLKSHNLDVFDIKNKYISRVFSKDYIKKFKFIRPRLKIGQAIIHHPNVIHSGGLNLGQSSRISIEIRLFNKKKFDLKKCFDPSLY